MQIVIDIPEEIYDYIHNEHVAMRVCDSHQVASAIANATPLEKVLEDIKADIEERRTFFLQGIDDGDDNIAFGLELALDIIDKHISEKEQNG